MKGNQLKMVSFSSKGYKKELIISTDQVEVMQAFLIEILSCDVMIINTNIGIDVYYNHINNQKKQIENAFLILLAKEHRSLLDFFSSDLNSKDEITLKIHQYFKRLINHPLLFKSYSKSLCYQININYAKNAKIIEALFLIWQDELLRLNDTDIKVYILRTFLSNLQLTYIQQSCKPELQDLLRSVIDAERSN
ncbi:hypothetical protein ACFFVB_15895 [Formosa undariae]|uniref:TetR/AcrR family transcriptional regulator n=1 Tax=Formosa undariae TaxID=1325436 RepID=A0ABV5F547_9FLAO